MNDSENESHVYSYKKIEDSKGVSKFFKYLRKILGDGDDGITEKEVLKYMKEIYLEDQFIGYIGFMRYNQDGKKYLGIHNFMILPELQRNGHGTNIIKNIIDEHKDTYDEIYCWVSKGNTKAINFYKKIAWVSSELTQNGFYVRLYKKRNKTTRKKYRKVSDKNK